MAKRRPGMSKNMMFMTGSKFGSAGGISLDFLRRPMVEPLSGGGGRTPGSAGHDRPTPT
jgi:hypothetical protein